MRLPTVTASPASQRRHRNAAIGALTAALAAAALIGLAWPSMRGLVWYGLYAIPAHLLVSVLANEPVLLSTAKDYPPALVATAGSAGCLVAIALDYAMIGWLVNHRLVRAEIDDSSGFRTAMRLFGRAPFLLIAGSAFLPVPFYPAKILAIARDYPVSRFCLALILGRFPRFYLLALGGQKVQAPDSALVSAVAALALMGGWGVWRTYRRNRRRSEGPA